VKIVLVFKMPSTHAEEPSITLDANQSSSVPLPNDEIFLSGKIFSVSKRTFRYFPEERVEITLVLIFHGSTEPAQNEERNDDLADRIAYLRSIREANRKQREEQS
jgi:hypothetical protein